MKINVNVGRPEIEEHYRYQWSKVSENSLGSELIAVMVWAGITVVYFAVFGHVDRSHIVLFVTVVVVSAVMEAIKGRRLRKRIVEEEVEDGEKRCSLTFSDEGIHSTSEHTEATVRWPAVRDVVETENMFQLYIDKYQAILVPKRCLDDERVFRDSLERWRNAA